MEDSAGPHKLRGNAGQDRDVEPGPKSRRFYEPELDALRFCAFLAVFLFHAVPSVYTGAHAEVLQAARGALSLGVPVFFLLSAYLITKLLLLERERTGRVDIQSFYVRRILRIWPLYFLFVAAMFVLGRVGVFALISGGRLAASLLFTGNIYVALFGYAANPVLPLWTISIEEQFYLVWPVLARRGAARLRMLAWVLLGAALVAVPVTRALAPEPTRALWTSSLVQFQFFALGSMLALRYVHRLPRAPLGVRALMALAGVGLMMVAAGPFGVNRELGPVVSPPKMLLAWLLIDAGVVLTFLAFVGAAQDGLRLPRWVTTLGKVSYGLYVFHVLALELCRRLSNRLGVHGGFRTMTALGLTIALALVSYRWVERPFLVIKERFAPIKTRLA